VIDEDGRVVHELVLPRSREEVFAFLVDAGRLVRWIGISAELEPVPGGRFRFEVQPGQWCEGEFVEVDPPARVAFRTRFLARLGSVAAGADPEPYPRDDPGPRLRALRKGATP
jgi:uncharacterized protein YndB with AHSA1/START domain